MLGVPFRFRGRSRERGVDCVGLAVLATGRGDAPADYGLRGGDAGRFGRWLAAAGLREVSDVLPGDLLPGDLLLVRAGATQFHLMVRVEGGFVHAHAGLRRVVETPGDAPPWPVVSLWRAETL